MKIKKVSAVTLILYTLLIYTMLFGISLFTDPYHKVFRADPECYNGIMKVIAGYSQTEYLTFYNMVYSHKQMDSLLVRLLNCKDVRTINNVAWFCKEKNLCREIELLEAIEDSLYSLPLDSVWNVNIVRNYWRGSSREMMDFPNNLRENLNQLKINCSDH